MFLVADVDMKRIGVLLIMLLMVACGNEAVSDNVKEDDKEWKQYTIIQY